MSSTYQTLKDFEKLQQEAKVEDFTLDDLELAKPKSASTNPDQNKPSEETLVTTDKDSSTHEAKEENQSGSGNVNSRSSLPSDLDGNFTDNELVSLTFKEDRYDPMEFEDAFEMLCFFNEHIKSGKVRPHKWQAETLVFLSKKSSKENPLRFIIAACNRSGKDAYVNAPYAVWFALSKIRSRVIITSSSYTQLKSQTESYIRTLCFTINDWYRQRTGQEHFEVFTVRKEHIVCNLTGSEIRLFVTDDPGKAEGFHPFPDYPDSELCIIINEAKSVKDEIFEALSRCTYHVWIEISSPGRRTGHMYKLYCRSKIWGKEDYEPGVPMCRKVTVYDCPHISKASIREDELDYGIYSNLFKSKNLAEFTTQDENVVIGDEVIGRLIDLIREDKVPKILLPTHRCRAGIDSAAGGDETTVYVFEGNRFLDKLCFRDKDTSRGALRIAEFLNRFKASHGLKENDVFGDDGGLGRSVLDKVRDLGWTVRRVLNQSAALNSREFRNRGAELYFNFKRICEEGLVILPLDDEKLHDQLKNRYFDTSEGVVKITLESKKKAKANGHPSPDRADATVLAFCGITIHDLIKARANQPLVNKPSRNRKPLPRFNTGEALEQYYDDCSLKGIESVRTEKQKQRAYGSMQIALNE